LPGLACGGPSSLSEPPEDEQEALESQALEVTPTSHLSSRPEQLKDIELSPVVGRLLFSADDGTRGPELWVSDGTPRGTRLLQELVPGPVGGNPSQFTATRRHVYFTFSNSPTGWEW
jgi:ELWxxDGT repeat protein